MERDYLRGDGEASLLSASAAGRLAPPSAPGHVTFAVGSRTRRRRLQLQDASPSPPDPGRGAVASCRTRLVVPDPGRIAVAGSKTRRCRRQLQYASPPPPLAPSVDAAMAAARRTRRFRRRQLQDASPPPPFQDASPPPLNLREDFFWSFRGTVPRGRRRFLFPRWFGGDRGGLGREISRPGVNRTHQWSWAGNYPGGTEPRALTGNETRTPPGWE